MKSTLLKIAMIVAVVAVIHSCKDDDDDTPPAPSADESLYDEITASGYSFYQGGVILAAASASPHGPFKLRFNATALAVLDSTGELPSGNAFPSGSILVKEVYDGLDLDLYAVMKKDPTNSNSGAGWVWAEYDSDGTVITSISSSGTACVSCHDDTPNRDLVRTFDLH